MKYLVMFVAALLGWLMVAMVLLGCTMAKVTAPNGVTIDYRYFFQDKDLKAVVGADGSWTVQSTNSSDPAIALMEKAFIMGNVAARSAVTGMVAP